MASSNTTQDFIPVKEIRDGVLVLKDDTMRAVIMVSSTNLGLKSSDEQASILYQFQNLLNSLDFSVQFFIQSKKLDIRPYLNTLAERQKEQVNELMKIQIREYIEFVKIFVERENIMAKNFFVVVPYMPAIINTSKGIGSFLGGLTKKKSVAETGVDFEENKSQLMQRVSVVEQGLSRCGLRSVLLGTEEIVELLYTVFNPGDIDKPTRGMNARS